MVRWIVMVVLLLALGPAMPAWADDREDCNNAANLLKTEPARAFAACRRMADTGDARAQHLVGIMYVKGLGVAQNDAEAVKWYRKAADQGFGPSQFIIGDRYTDGNGVPKDHVIAYMWLELAIRGGVPIAEIRDALARSMTPAQIDQAQALAAAWKPTTGQ